MTGRVVSGASGDGLDAPPIARGLAGLWARMLAAGLAGLTFVFGRLPLDRSLGVAAAFGRLWAGVGGPRTRRVRTALARALPEVSANDRARITGEVFVQLAQGLVELFVLRGPRRQALLDRVEVRGLEHARAAEQVSPAGGFLVVTAHLGNWELACAKVAELGFPVSVVYRGLRVPVLDRALFDLRAGAGRQPGGVPVEQLKLGRAGLPVVRALAAGRKVVVLLDQNADREEGVFVPFFGEPACTRSGPIALAALRGVPVVPAFIRRETGGRRHRLEIQPALELEPGAADDAAVLRRNVARVTRVIEEAIRRDPGQWIWLHRRWRTRPRAGDPVDGA